MRESWLVWNSGLQPAREGTDRERVLRFYPSSLLAKRPIPPRGEFGLAALLAALLLGLAAPAAAQGVYKFIDDRGVVHFTNMSPDARYTPLKVVQPPRSKSRKPPGPVRTYDDLIERVAYRHGIPPAMVKAVIHVESAFDPYAISHRGAMGLMQLMPRTAQSLGVGQPFRVTQNISGGARYLRMMYERFGNWPHALAAYNAGPSAVERYRGIPPYNETRQYVRRVLNHYRRYDAEFRS